jgi:cob(I)alamin adenosyltransferase
MLGRIQNEMFDLGADLATQARISRRAEMTLRIVPEQIDRLEREMDEMNETLRADQLHPARGGSGSAELPSPAPLPSAEEARWPAGAR